MTAVCVRACVRVCVCVGGHHLSLPRFSAVLSCLGQLIALCCDDK